MLILYLCGLPRTNGKSLIESNCNSTGKKEPNYWNLSSRTLQNVCWREFLSNSNILSGDINFVDCNQRLSFPNKRSWASCPGWKVTSSSNVVDSIFHSLWWISNLASCIVVKSNTSTLRSLKLSSGTKRLSSWNFIAFKVVTYGPKLSVYNWLTSSAFCCFQWFDLLKPEKISSTRCKKCWVCFHCSSNLTSSRIPTNVFEIENVLTIRNDTRSCLFIQIILLHRISFNQLFCLSTTNLPDGIEASVKPTFNNSKTNVYGSS